MLRWRPRRALKMEVGWVQAAAAAIGSVAGAAAPTLGRDQPAGGELVKKSRAAAQAACTRTLVPSACSVLKKADRS